MKLPKLCLVTETLSYGIGGVASFAHDFAEALSGDYDITIITGDSYSALSSDEFSVVNLDLSLTEDSAHRLIDELADAQYIVNSGSALMTAVTPYVSDAAHVVAVSHFVDSVLAFRAGYNWQWVDGIVALSTYGRGHLEKKFGAEIGDRISVIPNRVKANEMPALKEARFPGVYRRPGKKTQSSCEELTIVFPGGNNYYKGSDVVAKALKRYLLPSNRKFRFVWMGNCYIAGSRYVPGSRKSIADCFHPDERLEFTGLIGRDEARAILAKADVFVLPSRAEGFPISLCEALAGQCVPIISDAPHGSLDLIRNGENGIVVPNGDAKALAEAILDVVDDPEKYAKMALRAEASATRLLSVASWRTDYLNILSEAKHQKRKRFDGVEFSRSVRKLKCEEKRRRLKDKLLLLRNFYIYNIKIR